MIRLTPSLWAIAPRLALILTLPDPAPEVAVFQPVVR